MNTNNKFAQGIILILLSIVPFSYVNFVKHIDEEHCDKLIAIFKEFKQGRKSTTLLLHFENEEYEYQISGEYYNSMDKQAFNKYASPGLELEIWYLKPEFRSSLGQLSDKRLILNLSHQDVKILDIQKLRADLNHLPQQNMALGIIAVIGGLVLIIKSKKIKFRKPHHLV